MSPSLAHRAHTQKKKKIEEKYQKKQILFIFFLLIRSRSLSTGFAFDHQQSSQMCLFVFYSFSIWTKFASSVVRQIVIRFENLWICSRFAAKCACAKDSMDQCDRGISDNRRNEHFPANFVAIDLNVVLFGQSCCEHNGNRTGLIWKLNQRTNHSIDGKLVVNVDKRYRLNSNIYRRRETKNYRRILHINSNCKCPVRCIDEENFPNLCAHFFLYR